VERHFSSANANIAERAHNNTLLTHTPIYYHRKAALRLAGLTDMQKRFVDEYLIDLNATQAAIRAGYSANTAQEQGSRLLSNVIVREALNKAIARQSKRTGVTADRVIREFARIGFANVGQILDDCNGGLLDGLSEDDTAAISSVKTKLLKVQDDNVIMEREIKFHDKTKALEMLAKHLGILTENVNITHAGDVSIVVGDPIAVNNSPE